MGPSKPIETLQLLELLPDDALALALLLFLLLPQPAAASAAIATAVVAAANLILSSSVAL
ncbi:MAG: hypothetical protein JOZ73_11470 [Solirubrobacterales bacterium]|nr:hypothetical protein [Solirubrobacterales bacterium]